MFVVSLTYVCEMTEVDKHLNDHIEYLERQYANGVFLASGRKVPRTGGVILARAENREVLEQILSEDPFKVHGLANYDSMIKFLVLDFSDYRIINKLATPSGPSTLSAVSSPGSVAY